MHHRTAELTTALRLLGYCHHLTDSGQDVTQLQHCLRVATLAEEAGAADEFVVVALLHDAYKPVAHVHHGEVAAEALADKVPPIYVELLRAHGRFVASLNAIERGDFDVSPSGVYKPWFHALALEFAAWDHQALTPAATHPLSHFTERLERVFITGSLEPQPRST